MPRSFPLLRTQYAFRASSHCQPRLLHHHFTTSSPRRTSETPSSEEDYDYSWIQESELNLLREKRDLLPKPSVYMLFSQKLDEFEREMREKIKTNHLLTDTDLEIVHKLRAKLKIAEENNLKRAGLFNEIIREAHEEHIQIRAKLPKRKKPPKSQSIMAKKRR
ncbi:hypothetical protein EG328_002657 [Venturia inaequalis]|uniref:Uncharacterized protein n=1 Tax=Venturia inaequalis TaxID=5025 RepID=A0A8H3YYB4_VENIN|nr:hypothetical protein EG328_002657 [Venturia inaequalis]RDI86717.1 Dicarboxylic amino acid permease [Venturia inaequalis]